VLDGEIVCLDDNGRSVQRVAVSCRRAEVLRLRSAVVRRESSFGLLRQIAFSRKQHLHNLALRLALRWCDGLGVEV
jgi:hypothetical protein